MSFTVDTAFIHAFDENLLTLSQEAAEGWTGYVRTKAGQKGKTLSVERLQGVEAQPILSRHASTGFTPFTHSRRRLTIADFGLSEIIDDIDDMKMLISPESDYARGFAKAYARKTARTITTAMLGNALDVSSNDTVSSLALPSGQQISNGSTNMTMAKIRQANRILDVNGISESDRHIAVSPFAIEKLMSDSQVTSSDFSTLQAIRFGRIQENATFMGFQWHIVTDALGAGTTMADPILPKSGNVRSCIAWQKNAVVFAEQRGFQSEMPRDPSIWNNLRVLVKFSQGAVRVEDEGVVQIDIDETA